MRRLIFTTMVLLLSLPALAKDDVTPSYAYTYHQPSGNRYVEGRGFFPLVSISDYPLDALPLWSLNLPISDDSMAESRQVTILDLRTDSSASYPSPPVYHSTLDGGSDLPADIDQTDISPFTHLIPLAGGLLYIENITNNLVYWAGGGIVNRLPLNALPDARIVTNSSGQIAVYTGANDQRYTHGVLGDSIEATELSILEIIDSQLQRVAVIGLGDADVFEGLSPIWADVDGDGVDDLLTTVSNAQVGAQIRVFRNDGFLISTSDPIGLGGRWRHQLAFGPFGPNGELEIVDVRTPHIGGIVEFFQLQGNRLEIVASLPGYTSHVIGSRNLDMAVGGDFNGDGQPEIVLPVQDRSALAGLQHGPDGVVEVWRLPLDGRLTTNLAAVTLPDNTLALAAGTDANLLRVWLP